jgi:hypothetical protein
MKSLGFLYAAASACLIPACFAQGPVPVDHAPGKAAQHALEGFQKAMTDTVAQVLGFKNAEEGRRSRLGEAIRVFEPACNALLGVKDSAVSVDPRDPAGPAKFYYPILGDSGRKVALVLVAKLTDREKYGPAGDLGAAFLGYEASGEVRLSPVVLSDSATGCLRAYSQRGDLRAALAFSALGRCFDKAQICREFDPNDPKGWGLDKAHGDKR